MFFGIRAPGQLNQSTICVPRSGIYVDLGAKWGCLVGTCRSGSLKSFAIILTDVCAPVIVCAKVAMCIRPIHITFKRGVTYLFAEHVL